MNDRGAGYYGCRVCNLGDPQRGGGRVRLTPEQVDQAGLAQWKPTSDASERVSLPASEGELLLRVMGVWWSRHGDAYPMYLKLEVIYAGGEPDAIARVYVKVLEKVIDTKEADKLGALDAVDHRNLVLKFLPPFANESCSIGLVLQTVRGRAAEVRFEAAPSGWCPDELWIGFKPY